MNNTSNLIERVQTLINKNEEIINASEERFNVFSVFKVNHYENSHSNLLAELLNPRGTHSLNAIFLDLFIKNILRCDDFIFNTEEAQVIREYVCKDKDKEGRIDILIKSGQSAIIIENKIRSGDQWEQLKRYKEFAEREFSGGYKLIYLTLSGYRASEQSGGGVDYIPVSYQSEIITWLEECAKVAYDRPMVRETIRMYICHIKRLTNIDIDKRFEEEILEIMSTKENLLLSSQIADKVWSIREKKIDQQDYPEYNTVAAKKIEGLLFKAKDKVLKEHFNKNLRCRLSEIGCEIYDFGTLNHLTTSWWGFYITPKDWTYFKINFEFGTKGAQDLHYGILSKSVEVKNNEVILELNKLSKKKNNHWHCIINIKKHRFWSIQEYSMMFDSNSDLYNEIIVCVQNLLDRTNHLSM